MRDNTKILVFVAVIILSLALPACDWFRNPSTRETIFDKVVNIPDKLILDISKLPPLCDEIFDLKKGFIDILDGKLYYEEEGRGIPLVLINGGPGGTHHDFHPCFSRARDFAHIIYYDQRGTGKSSIDNTGKTYSVRQAVEDLESLRKALKIDQWVVLGWSYGGFLAQCYALTYPENVNGLILVAAADGLKKVKMKPSRQQMFISKEEQAAIRKVWLAEGDGQLTLVQALYNAHLTGDWKRQSYYKPTPEGFIREALYEWNPAPGFRDLICSDEDKIGLDGMFDDFEIPTLIFEGKWDLTWDTDKAEFMRRNHPHSQVEIFKKSGHRIFGDEPEKFFDILQTFLEKAVKTQIEYRPGNRLTWPNPPSDFELKIVMAQSLQDKQERENKILALFDQAVKTKSKEASTWWLFFHCFFSPQKNDAHVFYENALYALQQYEHTVPKSNPEQLKEFGHCIKVWRGEVLDLLGRRGEAIECYKDVLQNFKEKCDHCSKVDRKWLEERLKTPFKWD